MLSLNIIWCVYCLNIYGFIFTLNFYLPESLNLTRSLIALVVTGFKIANQTPKIAFMYSNLMRKNNDGNGREHQEDQGQFSGQRMEKMEAG